MKYLTLSVLFLPLLLSSCLSDIQSHLQQCTADASARYPSTAATPPGQPFKDIYGCMWNEGYDIDSNAAQCRGVDYTVAVSHAECYRPKSMIGGFFHDLGSLLR